MVRKPLAKSRAARRLSSSSTGLLAMKERVLKAFQLVTSNNGLVCPADWDEGKDTMAADSEGMKKYLSTHQG